MVAPVNNLESYYESLAKWEGQPATSLVALWDQGDVAAISEDFQTAFVQGEFQSALLPIAVGTSNQSIGNKVAEFLVKGISRHLRRFRIDSCSGPGYPDKRLASLANPRAFPF